MNSHRSLRGSFILHLLLHVLMVRAGLLISTSDDRHEYDSPRKLRRQRRHKTVGNDESIANLPPQNELRGVFRSSKGLVDAEGRDDKIDKVNANLHLSSRNSLPDPFPLDLFLEEDVVMVQTASCNLPTFYKVVEISTTRYQIYDTRSGLPVKTPQFLEDFNGVAGSSFILGNVYWNNNLKTIVDENDSPIPYATDLLLCNKCDRDRCQNYYENTKRHFEVVDGLLAHIRADGSDSKYLDVTVDDVTDEILLVDFLGVSNYPTGVAFRNQQFVLISTGQPAHFEFELDIDIDDSTIFCGKRRERQQYHHNPTCRQHDFVPPPSCNPGVYIYSLDKVEYDSWDGSSNVCDSCNANRLCTSSNHAAALDEMEGKILGACPSGTIAKCNRLSGDDPSLDQKTCSNHPPNCRSPWKCPFGCECEARCRGTCKYRMQCMVQ